MQTVTHDRCGERARVFRFGTRAEGSLEAHCTTCHVMWLVRHAGWRHWLRLGGWRVAFAVWHIRHPVAAWRSLRPDTRERCATCGIHDAIPEDTCNIRCACA